MRRSTELPEDLRRLVRRNALSVTTTSFDGDCQRLEGAIRQVLEKAAAEERQREKEQLEAEQREKERPEADPREREEEGRLKAKRAETEVK
jgi:hypothetical protein